MGFKLEFERGNECLRKEVYSERERANLRAHRQRQHINNKQTNMKSTRINSLSPATNKSNRTLSPQYSTIQRLL